MKLVLQNRKTLLFVEGPSKWTPEPSEACVFAKTSQVVVFCHEHRLTDMQVIMKYPEAGVDFAVPLPPSFDTQSRRLEPQFAHFPYP